MKTPALLLSTCLLAATATNDGCPAPPPEAPNIELTQGNAEALKDAHSSRFTIHREAKFDDAFAYGGKRAIYILTDTETGRQYVGVSGIGLGELGSHQVDDKNTVKDER